MEIYHSCTDLVLNHSLPGATAIHWRAQESSTAAEPAETPAQPAAGGGGFFDFDDLDEAEENWWFLQGL